MKLIVIGSNSSGNAYALDAGGEILLLEAGIRHSLVTKALKFRDSDIVGCCVSHVHGDHCKYAEEYCKRGITIYCNRDVAEKKKFAFGKSVIISEPLETVSIGSFRVFCIPLNHDVPNNGYLIQHPDMGTLLFATDTYKLDFNLTDVNHFLIEANYDDKTLKDNVRAGRIDRQQANRLMVSHMELHNTIRFLDACINNEGGSPDSTKTITLCHLSERNSSPEDFQQLVAREFAIPTYIASKGAVINLSKDII